MHAVGVIQEQFKSINNLLQEFVNDLTDDEWGTTILPNTNPFSFTCWHVARTWDWAIQTCIRGVPEVVADERWASWSELAHAGFGAGITREQADEVARVVSRNDVIAYTDAVHTIVQKWLSSLSDVDLDTVPDMKAHMAPYPAYLTPGMREETDQLQGTPTLRLLISPCIGHQRGHLGEIDLLRQTLRERAVQV